MGKNAMVVQRKSVSTEKAGREAPQKKKKNALRSVQGRKKGEAKRERVEGGRYFFLRTKLRGKKKKRKRIMF